MNTTIIPTDELSAKFPIGVPVEVNSGIDIIEPAKGRVVGYHNGYVKVKLHVGVTLGIKPEMLKDLRYGE